MHRDLVETFDARVKLRPSDCQRTSLSGGVHQIVWCSWKENLPGVAFQAASLHDRCMFGPGVFRPIKHEMSANLVARIDPWQFTIEFLDNQLYVDHGVIRWIPVKLQRVLLADLPAFRDQWSEPNTISLLMYRAHDWFKSLRPADWAESQHLNEPRINTTTAEAEELAAQVARWVDRDSQLPSN